MNIDFKPVPGWYASINDSNNPELGPYKTREDAIKMFFSQRKLADYVPCYVGQFMQINFVVDGKDFLNYLIEKTSESGYFGESPLKAVLADEYIVNNLSKELNALLLKSFAKGQQSNFTKIFECNKVYPREYINSIKG